MNSFNITGFLVIGLVSLTLITVTGMLENVEGQLTDFETLFDKPEYQLCRQSFNDTTSSNPAEWTSEEICDVSILSAGHQTNNSLMINTNHPGYLGPSLDAIYEQGYKSEIIIPHNSPDDSGAWIYFRR